jgi:HTH-type transcriptional regulator/antitoxin HigA
MHVISRKTLRQFWAQDPDSERALGRWFKIMQRHDFTDFATLPATFPTADKVGDYIVFNIGGNKYRLITAFHFNRRKVYIPSCPIPPGIWPRSLESMTAIPYDLQQHWTAIGPLLSIRNEHEYDLTVERLNRLLDEVGTDGQHPLYTLLDTLGTLIYAYEEEHHPIPACSGADVLRFLMDEHGLTQSDLPEVGSQGVVSDILRGKRELNVRQIRALATRFQVSPAVFI